MATTHEMREEVRKRYASVAVRDSSCCGAPAPEASCCGDGSPEAERSKMLGYSDEELSSVPEAVAKSAMAYSACVGGAVLKEGYLEQIRLAGFGEVTVEEVSFPIEAILGDPNIKALLEGDELALTEDEIRTGADTAVSVKVTGMKLHPPDCCG